MVESGLPVPVVRLSHALDLDLPAYASEGAAGLDLMAALPPGEEVVLAPLGRAVIPCGIALALPPGFEAQVRPRSGLAARHGITVLNAPGTIDSDYRGEVGAVLVNLGDRPFVIERGMRIAQLVIAAVARIDWRPTENLPGTTRGAGGYGSTGMRG
jgi:dUTP pyrophosphatase